MIFALLFWAIAAAFLFMSLSALFHQRWAQRLPSVQSLVAPGGGNSTDPRIVRCSVVIAARDEQARIEQTVRHLLAQTGVELEIIVIDDRSRDGTHEILKKLAEEDCRVRVIRVDALPEGWLGKCHACDRGAEIAKGD